MPRECATPVTARRRGCAAWKERDPIKLFRERVLADGSATKVELAAVEAEVKAMAEEAGKFAEASPIPDPATVGGVCMLETGS